MIGQESDLREEMSASMLTGRFHFKVDGSDDNVEFGWIEVAGCKWQAKAKRSVDNEGRDLRLYLECKDMPAESAYVEMCASALIKRGDETTFTLDGWVFSKDNTINGFKGLGEFPTIGQKPCNLDLEFTVVAERDTRMSRRYSFGSAASCPGVSNVVFIVGSEEKKIHACKEVLAAASPVFHTMFSGGYREARENEVRLAARNPDDFVNFIAHIYHCGNLGERTESLMELANYYDVRYLVEECERYYLGRAGELPVLDLVKIACQYKFSSLLIKTAERMTASDLVSLKDTETWFKLSVCDREAILGQVIEKLSLTK